MTRIKRISVNTAALIALIVLFVALTMLSNGLFRGMRLDLTENGLYTLSKGTRNILADIDEPINLYYFFSQQSSREIPALRTYANRITELLEEYVLEADGKLKLQIIDPLPFSEEEDRAAQFGLQAVPIGATGESLYFGLAGTNAIGDVEVIPFFQPDKEAFLEYDVSKLIYSLAHPKKPIIGLLSTLPMTAGFDPTTGQMRQPWIINEQLNQLFEIRNLDPEVTTIDEDINVLMLVHPKDLSKSTLYAIDQFVLRGGRVLVFLDPYAEADVPAQNPNNPGAAMLASRASDLPELLQAWGIAYDKTQFAADSRYALAVTTRPDQAPVRHLGILSLDDGALAREDVVTAGLETINLALAGYFSSRENAETTLLPLLTSSKSAMPMAVDQVRFLPDPSQLYQGFAPTGEHYILAARLQGKVQTAFPDGAPAGINQTDKQHDEQNKDEEKDEKSTSSHLKESAEPVNVIIVADTDLLTDRLWVRQQNFFGQRIVAAWANNGDFITNALDNLTGNSDLISIRGRATSSRPFTTVEALEREANNRLLATEQQLQEELRETERKLTELQQSRSDNNTLILSPEQQAELERFQQRKLEIRKQLRQVRRDLDKNIEQLGTTLKLINIALIPLLLSGVALCAVWMRARRRKMGAKPV